MNTPDDGRLHRAHALFDAQVEALDGATATALRARRREAIATIPTRSRRAWWWPTSGLVTAALALAVVMPRSASIDDVTGTGAVASHATAATSGVAAVEDGQAEQAAQFADGALVEFENDAEFYAWLATLPAESAADTPSPPPHSPNTPHEG
ncbi:hypothetical protein [Silanimonas sp.]|jgi:hypothetical protein|uniref:hypothetical protein n=1 Tax=Silanimonas sp. TaxID=1929290 RepID=UPI0037CAD276